jgi:CO dehydrogenase nickel-insertion accessory protein CooC1
MVKKSILCFPFVTCAGESVHTVNGDDDEELTRTMGVTNSTKKLGSFNKDGKK